MVNQSINRSMNQKMSTARRPSTPPGSTSHVYLVGTVAAIGGLLFGYDTGVVSGALLWIPKVGSINR